MKKVHGESFAQEWMEYLHDLKAQRASVNGYYTPYRKVVYCSEFNGVNWHHSVESTVLGTPPATILQNQ